MFFILRKLWTIEQSICFTQTIIFLLIFDKLKGRERCNQTTQLVISNARQKVIKVQTMCLKDCHIFSPAPGESITVTLITKWYAK